MRISRRPGEVALSRLPSLKFDRTSYKFSSTPEVAPVATAYARLTTSQGHHSDGSSRRYRTKKARLSGAPGALLRSGRSDATPTGLSDAKHDAIGDG